MSRSYKKHPIFKLKNSLFSKKHANKIARYYKHLYFKGKSYKKLFDSWDICDYRFFPTDDKDRKLLNTYKYKIK